MKILAIDTSCDETCAAVTEGNSVLSNVIWSQASQHAKFGGVMPSLAQRMHRERIDWVVNKAIRDSHCPVEKIEAIAVTAGPGLAIALEVGIGKAKELAERLKVPLIPINHVEAHLLSALAKPVSKHKNESLKEAISFPVFGLVVSGGHTELVLVEKIGKYRILAKTQDDALGEALDKAARMLGLGYPGGAILEKMAKEGDFRAYPLPLPMSRSNLKNAFSYSGLKTAFWRLVGANEKNLNAKEIKNLAATFQNRAFQHLEKVVFQSIQTSEYKSKRDLLVGGGVAVNIELRKRLRKLGKELGVKVRFPYSSKLIGDNAAMIGITAGFKLSKSGIIDYGEIDRKPRWSVEEV